MFSSSESANYDSAWIVWRGKRAAPFLRDKLLLSLYKSCEHRRSAISDAGSLVQTVINKLQLQIVDGSISAAEIGRVAQVALNRFDRAASSHYAAHHR